MVINHVSKSCHDPPSSLPLPPFFRSQTWARVNEKLLHPRGSEFRRSLKPHGLMMYEKKKNPSGMGINLPKKRWFWDFWSISIWIPNSTELFDYCLTIECIPVSQCQLNNFYIKHYKTPVDAFLFHLCHQFSSRFKDYRHTIIKKHPSFHPCLFFLGGHNVPVLGHT